MKGVPMIREREAEPWVKQWLEAHGFLVVKGENVDLEVRDGRFSLVQVVEVKGDQRNRQAFNNTFLMALGQVFVALTSHPGAKVSLALTRAHWPSVKKYHDVLRSNCVSVIWVRGEDDIILDDLASLASEPCVSPTGRRKRRGCPVGQALFIGGTYIGHAPGSP
jgi:hypothetical protein